mmetsp:Transcript_97152/g.173043  ORF Transcript_97152/g.173043 Transcript_97152/m.173043 type:complete len:581 (-) Transcript_97152:94-1836(-)
MGGKSGSKGKGGKSSDRQYNVFGGERDRGRGERGGKGEKGSGKRERGGGKKSEEERELDRLNWFDNLPKDSLTDEELDLRAELMAALDKVEPGSAVRLSLVIQEPAVRTKKSTLLPPFVSVTNWIEQRLGEEIQVVRDASEHRGEAAIRLRAAAPEGDALGPVEAFFESLPGDSFTEEEMAMRDGLILALDQCGGSSTLTALLRGSDKANELNGLKQFLPRGMAVVTWIERRLGSDNDIELFVSDGGASCLRLRSSQPMEPANGKSGQAEKRVKGKLPQLLEPEMVLPAKEEEREDRVAKSEEFLASLPVEFTPEEEVLRERLLDAWSQQRKPNDPVVRWSNICQVPAVVAAKRSLLPNKVSVTAWVEARMAGEWTFSKKNDQTMAEYLLDYAGPDPMVEESRPKAAARKPAGPSAAPEAELDADIALASMPPMDASEKDSIMQGYFRGPLLPEEEPLARACVDAVARRAASSDNTPGLLSEVLNGDPAFLSAWKRAKSVWLAKDPPLEATLSRWVELRMADEVQVVREPYVKLTKSALQRLAPKKRPPPSAPRGPVAKQPRTGGFRLRARPSRRPTSAR